MKFEENSEERVGSLKGNYYSQVRKEQKSNENSWIFDAIQDMLNYIYQIVQNTQDKVEYPDVEIGIDDVYLEKLEEFKKYSRMDYDSTNETHEKLLLKLWKLSSPNKNLDNRISESWKDIGFQGKDPATDFRGVGVYGLWNLIFFASTYPKKYSRLIEKTKKDKTSYPFVIAGLNVTMMLFEILGFGFQAKKSKNTEARKKFIQLISDTKGSLNSKNWFFEEEEEEKELKEEILLDFGEFETKKEVKKKKKKKKGNLLFEQVFIAGFIIMDQEWYGMNATYFSFPKVLELTRTRVQDLLESDWTCIEDVVSFNKK